jgi:hypothetical protein
MAINEWAIWRKLFPRKEEKVDIPTDLEAIYRFLNEMDSDKQRLLKDITQARLLFSEAKVVNEELLDENLKHHIDVFDQVLQDYESFQNDVDINGIRVKKIAKELLRRASARGLSDIVKEKLKESRWRGNW